MQNFDKSNIGSGIRTDPSKSHHEVIQGKVTQLFSNFGYINDNIIFSKSDVMGTMVAIGDKVAVCATFQPNNPSKFKGERVVKIEEPRISETVIVSKNINLVNTSLTNQAPVSQTEVPISNKSDKANENKILTPKIFNPVDNNKKVIKPIGFTVDLTESDAGETIKQYGSTIKYSLGKAIVSPNKKQPTNKELPQDNEKPLDKKLIESDSSSKNSKTIKKNEEASKSESAKRSAISPIKFKSPPKVGIREKSKSESKYKPLIKNYETFSSLELDCAAVRHQYRTLVLPDEFFHVSLKYQHSFPLNHPMKLGHNCQFKVMDKRVKCIDSATEDILNKDIDPEDADSTFVAKVMLLSTDDLSKLYQDTLILAEEFDGATKMPITKAIKFLVASVGQDKEFAIGGSWSPSLDGQDPETNPQVLINTAIRTCKSITGIDLSQCTTWPKFLELHYYRPMRRKVPKTKLEDRGDGPMPVIDVDVPEEYVEPRVETVVYYVPDVWTCMPSGARWEDISQGYKKQLAGLMCPPPPPPPPVLAHKEDDGAQVRPSDVSNITSTEVPVGECQDEEDWNETETADGDKRSLVDEATHYSKLTVSTMKIAEIKKELELRGLKSKGIMLQLKVRLQAALDKEEAQDRNKGCPTSDLACPVSSTTVAVASKCGSSSFLTEDQKNDLKKLYSLPDRPEIIVHQNKKVIVADMKMRTMSLHSLLSYYDKKLEENTFELAIFGKQFLDMLRRDAVFNIYKSLVVASDQDLGVCDQSTKKPNTMVTTSKRTVDKSLLFSCCVLDRDKIGKISLEELKIFIEGLGICLSSDQLCAVVGKGKNDSKYLNYRQLTDKEVSECDISHINNNHHSEDLDYIKELAMGNKALFDNDDEMSHSQIDQSEIEILKNDLDRSERSVQSMEVRIEDIKQYTETNVSLAEQQAKEIKQLQEQASEYKTKYHKEQSRSDKYKRDYERMLSEVRDLNSFTASLTEKVTKCVSAAEADSVGSKSKDVDDDKKVKNGARKKSQSKENDSRKKSESKENDSRKKSESKENDSKKKGDSKENDKMKEAETKENGSRKKTESKEKDSSNIGDSKKIDEDSMMEMGEDVNSGMNVSETRKRRRESGDNHGEASDGCGTVSEVKKVCVVVVDNTRTISVSEDLDLEKPPECDNIVLEDTE